MGDGRLMPVDSSGTFVRARADKSQLARPPIVGTDFWNACSLLEQKRLVEEYTATRGRAIVARRLRTFAVREPNIIYSTWPPASGPPPEVIIRRVVYREADPEVVEDHETIGWEFSDSHRPPEVIRISCEVVYINDSAIAGPLEA